MGLRVLLLGRDSTPALLYAVHVVGLQGLKVIDLQMSDYMKHLEQAVQFGLPVLLQNVLEKLDASLDPILNKSVIHVGQ